MFGILRLAYKLLVNDRAKFTALLIGITFAVFLMTEITAMFAGVLNRASATVINIGARRSAVGRPGGAGRQGKSNDRRGGGKLRSGASARAGGSSPVFSYSYNKHGHYKLQSFHDCDSWNHLQGIHRHDV